MGLFSLNQSWGGILVAIVLPCALAASLASSGNLTERQEACATYSLPAELRPYLNISFLGEREYVSVGSVNMSYYAFGPLAEATSDVTLVLIAGQGATLSVWTPTLLSGLAQGRTVVIFDSPGIGASLDAAEPPSYTVPGLADATAGLIEALDLEQADVLGWSLGGATAMALALQYPQLVHRLVLAETAPGGPGFGLTEEAAEAFAQLEPFINNGIPLPPGVIFPDTPAGNEALCRTLYLWAAMPADMPTTEQALKQAGAIAGYAGAAGDPEWYDLGNITAPTLIIAGAQDAALPIIEQQALYERIPGASLVQFEDAGHAAILQHSLTCAALVSAFLDDDVVQA